jgi:hypothetical protein
MSRLTTAKTQKSAPAVRRSARLGSLAPTVPPMLTASVSQLGEEHQRERLHERAIARHGSLRRVRLDAGEEEPQAEAEEHRRRQVADHVGRQARGERPQSDRDEPLHREREARSDQHVDGAPARRQEQHGVRRLVRQLRDEDEAEGGEEHWQVHGRPSLAHRLPARASEKLASFGAVSMQKRRMGSGK